MDFRIIGGGTPSAPEVAAIIAALELTRRDRQAAVTPPAGRWRWSGRWWTETAGAPNWRNAPSASHPSFS